MTPRGVPASLASDLAVALQQSEARYRSLVQRASFGIYVATIDGHFLDVNPALVRMLGYDNANQLLALDIRRDVYLDPDERDRLIARSGESGGNWAEARWKRRDGTPITVRIALQRIEDEQGDLIGFEGITEDVTERKRQEELLRRSERMASLGTTLAGVAHELNNPLAAIMGFAQLLLKREWTDDDRMAIETISHEAERSAKIVRDLLTLARKREATRRAPVNLNDVVGYIMRTRRYALETSAIGCDIDLDPTLPCVCGDRTQLEQVLLNLVTNAEQALRSVVDTARAAGREVGFSPRLAVRTRREGNDAILEVSDNGPGIPPESHSQIWDPFWTTRAEGEGTGLGLSVVHHIVVEHGGTIDVSSASPTGACFRARLPVSDEPAEAIQRRSSGTQATRALDVLVVAAADTDQQFITRFLTSRGHAVLATSDLDRARRFAEQMAFDTVILDGDTSANAPVLLHDLRSFSGCTRARMVLAANPRVAQNAVPAPALPHGTIVITKPYDVEQLRQAVEG